MKASLLCATLKAIPTHKERPLSRAELITKISAECQISTASAETSILITSELCSLLDLTKEVDEHFSLGGQMQTYCRNSLVWFLENDKSLLSNWERHGTAQDEISIANLLEQAPYLLKAFEQRRKHLSKKLKLPLTASREQPCSVVIFKAIHSGKTYLLHQWDQKSERYQIIGGKQRSNESPEETAAREAVEEIIGTKLIIGKTFFLSNLPIGPFEEYEVSRTYGALTHYKIHVFQARVELHELIISEADLWISTEEMIAGKTFAGAAIASLGGLIAREHRPLLESLPQSMDFGPNLKVSSPSTKTTKPNSHNAEPEIPAHLTINWLLGLVKRLALHELALLVGVATSVLGGAFALGRLYESRTSSTTQSISPAATVPGTR